MGERNATLQHASARKCTNDVVTAFSFEEEVRGTKLHSTMVAESR